MIRSNLATRPFYNERAAHVFIGVFALFVAFLTIFNVVRVITLSSRNTALSVDIRRDEDTAARLRQEAVGIRSRINQQELDQVIAGAQEANALIDRRTFSWTEFFNLIEQTMPENVMLTSVSPEVDKGQTIVNMTVLGRRAEDVDNFMEQLEGTKAFRGVQPLNEDVTEEGLHRVQLSAEYIAPHTQAPKQTVSRLITKIPKATKTPEEVLNSLGAFESFGVFAMSRRPSVSRSITKTPKVQKTPKETNEALGDFLALGTRKTPEEASNSFGAFEPFGVFVMSRRPLEGAQ